jgi:dolichol-phosphate mannosyltransferase
MPYRYNGSMNEYQKLQLDSTNKEILIFTATLNEYQNISIWYDAVKKQVPDADLLIIDDNSTDGTKEYLSGRETTDSNLTVFHREKKNGLASAHLLAFEFAKENGYKKLVTMDADLSHRPTQILTILGASENFDFVIGTRAGAGSNSYVGFRKLLSSSANLLCRILINMKMTEFTTSFRCYNDSAIHFLLEEKPKSESYSFFIEVVHLLSKSRLALTEVPIDFDNRAFGKSKIPTNQAFLTCGTLMRLTSNRILFKIKNLF